MSQKFSLLKRMFECGQPDPPKFAPESSLDTQASVSRGRETHKARLRCLQRLYLFLVVLLTTLVIFTPSNFDRVFKRLPFVQAADFKDMDSKLGEHRLYAGQQFVVSQDGKSAFVKDKSFLNQKSLIQHAEPMRHHLKKQGVHLPLQTQAMLEQYLMMKDDQGFISDEGIDTQQAILTQMRSVEGLLDADKHTFENSIGIMNSQQFFPEDTNKLVGEMFLIEDILTHRMVQLANLTSQIVYDDGESNNKSNRHNPEMQQLKEFYHLNRKLMDKIKEGNTSAMFLEALARPQLIKSLEKSLNFSIREAVKNYGHYYTDLNKNQTYVSYRTAKHRFLIHKETYYGQSLRQDLPTAVKVNDNAKCKNYQPMFLHIQDYHQKELQVLDDLTVDLIDQKNFKGKKEEGTPMLGPGVTKEYKTRFYGKKSCKDKLQQDHIEDDIDNEDIFQQNKPKFQPKFGSFYKEVISDHDSEPSSSVYDYPIDEIAKSESRRVVQKILSMRALKHHRDNFGRLVKLFQNSEGLNISKSIQEFQKIFFTYGDTDQIAKLMQGVFPTQIQDLYQEVNAAKFFDEAIDISPKKVIVREPIPLLTEKVEYIQILNKKMKQLQILDIMTSSPDIEAAVEGSTFALPGETLKIKVKAQPSNQGIYDALIYIVFKNRVYVSTFKAFAKPNKFGLEPIYFDRVPYLTQVSQLLQVANPYSKDLKVESIRRLGTNSRNLEVKTSNMVIGADLNATIGNLSYTAKDLAPSLEATNLQIKFSTDELVHVPVFVRTVNNLVEMKPQIIDFGLVQMNQQALKMDVWVTVNINQVQRITDYYIPTSEQNLDFALLDPVDLMANREDMKPRRLCERQRRQRKACIDENGFSTFLIGSVYLRPFQPKFIATSIKMELEVKNRSDGGTNGTVVIELPIIGSVVNHTNLFSASKVSTYYNSSEPLPLYVMDVHTGVDDPFKYHDITHETDLVLKNNLKQPLFITKIFSMWSSGDHVNQKKKKEAELLENHNIQDANDEFYTFKYHSNQDQFLIKMGKFPHLPNEAVSYGMQTITTSNFHMSDKRHLIWLKVGLTPESSILIPQQIVAHKNQLLCQWKPKGDVQLCSMINNLDFGDIALSKKKEMVLKIANPNPVPITFEDVVKGQLDEVGIDLVKILNRQGDRVDPVWNKESLIPQKGGKQLFSKDRLKKYIGLVIQPFEQVYLSFKVSIGVKQKQELDKTRQLTAIGKTNAIKLSFGKNVKPIEMVVKHMFQRGHITLEPERIKFKPAFQAMPQKIQLYSRSNFSKIVEIKSIRSTDPRVKIQQQTDVMAINNFKTNIATISFEAAYTNVGKKQQEIFEILDKYRIERHETKKVQAKKGGSKVNKKINDDIADRERMDRNNEHLLEFFWNDMDQPEQKVRWLQIPTWPQGMKGSAQLSNYHDLYNAMQQKELYLIQKRDKSLIPRVAQGIFAKVLPQKEETIKLENKDFIYLMHKEKQWKKMKKSNKINISSTIEVETDVMGTLKVPVEAQLKKPQLVDNDKIDFGVQQVGTQQSRDVFLENPSSVPVKLKLFVAYDLETNIVNDDELAEKMVLFMNGHPADQLDGVHKMMKIAPQTEKILPLNKTFISHQYNFIKDSEDFDQIVEFDDFADESFMEIEQLSNVINSAKSFDQEVNITISAMYNKLQQQTDQNYIAKYCARVFIDQNKDLLDLLKNHKPESLVISDKKGQLQMCAEALNHLHYLKVSDFATESIQHHFEIMYQAIFDHDARIQKLLEISELEKNLKYKAQKQSLEAVKSFIMFESLLSWNRQESETQYAGPMGTMIGAHSRFTENYSKYLSQTVPKTSYSYQRPSTREEQMKAEHEMMKIDAARILHSQDGFEISNEQLKKAWGREQQRVTRDLEREKRERYIPFLTQINIMSHQVKELLLTISDVIGPWILNDAYHSAKIRYAELDGNINPIADLDQRFSLKSNELQEEVFSNNIRWLKHFLDLRMNAIPFEDYGMNNQFYQDEIRMQMFNYKMEQSGQKIQPAPFQVQNFFLHPVFKDKEIEIAPKSNITLKGAIIFEPQVINQKYNSTIQQRLKLRNMAHIVSNIDQRPLNMQLLIKNNLSHIDKVDLRGHGSSAYLEVVDVKKPLWFLRGNETDLISVQNTNQVQLKALADILEHPNLEQIDNFSFDDIQQLDRRIKRQIDLRKLTQNTDLHLVTAMFSEFIKKFEHTEDVFNNKYRVNEEDQSEQQENNEPWRMDPKLDDDVIQAFGDKQNAEKTAKVIGEVLRHSQWSFMIEPFEMFIRGQVRDLNLQQKLNEQNFQNYFVINIPLTDIFRSPETSQHEEAKNNEPVELDFDEPEVVSTCSYEIDHKKATLFFMDENWLDQAQKKSAREQVHLFQDQRRKRNKYKEKANLRQVIGSAMGIWDKQDLRVDINWTNLQTSIRKGQVILEREHKRVLLVQNTGTLPLKVLSIDIDGMGCSESNTDAIKLNNCELFINQTFNPGQNISIEILINYNFPRKIIRRTMQIETMHFTQNFIIDVMVPEKVISMVQKTEKSQGKSDQLTIVSYLFWFCKLILVLCILAVICAAVTVIKKDLYEKINTDQSKTYGYKVSIEYNKSWPKTTNLTEKHSKLQSDLFQSNTVQQLLPITEQRKKSSHFKMIYQEANDKINKSIDNFCEEAAEFHQELEIFNMIKNQSNRVEKEDEVLEYASVNVPVVQKQHATKTKEKKKKKKEPAPVVEVVQVQNSEVELAQEEPKKKLKGKGINKKEQKKQEARLKREQELIQNAKRDEDRQLERQKLLEKLQNQEQEKQSEDTEPIEQEQTPQQDPQIVPLVTVQSKDEDNDIDIKSYHSSEEEFRKKKPKKDKASDKVPSDRVLATDESYQVQNTLSDEPVVQSEEVPEAHSETPQDIEDLNKQLISQEPEPESQNASVPEFSSNGPLAAQSNSTEEEGEAELSGSLKQEDEDESDKPLFQQKKYLEMAAKEKRRNSNNQTQVINPKQYQSNQKDVKKPPQRKTYDNAEKLDKKDSRYREQHDNRYINQKDQRYARNSPNYMYDSEKKDKRQQYQSDGRYDDSFYYDYYEEERTHSVDPYQDDQWYAYQDYDHDDKYYRDTEVTHYRTQQYDNSNNHRKFNFSRGSSNYYKTQTHHQQRKKYEFDESRTFRGRGRARRYDIDYRQRPYTSRYETTSAHEYGNGASKYQKQDEYYNDRQKEDHYQDRKSDSQNQSKYHRQDEQYTEKKRDDQYMYQERERDHKKLENNSKPEIGAGKQKKKIEKPQKQQYTFRRKMPEQEKEIEKSQPSEEAKYDEVERSEEEVTLPVYEPVNEENKKPRQQKTFFETFQDIQNLFHKNLNDPQEEADLQDEDDIDDLLGKTNPQIKDEEEDDDPLSIFGGNYISSIFSTKKSQNEENTGLSNSSLAFLRERAMNAERESMLQQLNNKVVDQPSQPSTFGSLPIPKFLQERAVQGRLPVFGQNDVDEID